MDGEVLATVLVVDELDFGAASLGHLLLLGVLAHSERHSTCARHPIVKNGTAFATDADYQVRQDDKGVERA